MSSLKERLVEMMRETMGEWNLKIYNSGLTEREIRVVELRYAFPEDGGTRNLEEIGREIGRSRWTVGRDLSNALGKLGYPQKPKRQLRRNNNLIHFPNNSE